ncbi:MAG: MarR family transcriptional regulator, partial [Nostoc sp.]
MTQNSSKIQGKFYPLQHDEWLKACLELTPAQKDVLYYIRTLDPYGDGVELSVSGIARQLSTENKEVHRSTVSRALKALDDRG